MAARRLPMKKIRETLKLLWSRGLGARATARVCGMSHSTVLEYERRASKAGLSWEQVEEMDLGTLERRLFPRRATDSPRPLPEWSEIHAELKRPGVTLQLLWEEYREIHPEGYQYSRFCDLYRSWRGKLDLSMRQDHQAGEKVFVDYCGHTVAVADASSSTERRAQVFVAVLGASNYTYAEATWSQGMVDWIGSHRRAFEYFGGVPEVIVPVRSTEKPLALTSRAVRSAGLACVRLIWIVRLPTVAPVPETLVDEETVLLSPMLSGSPLLV